MNLIRPVRLTQEEHQTIVDAINNYQEIVIAIQQQNNNILRLRIAPSLSVMELERAIEICNRYNMIGFLVLETATRKTFFYHLDHYYTVTVFEDNTIEPIVNIVSNR